jgi:hypothetical protein
MKIREILIYRNLYLAGMFMLMILVIFTPRLVQEGFSIFEEESVEVIIIIFLINIGIIIYYLYEKEVEKQNATIRENWKHIGNINIQIERFKMAFLAPEKLPENRNELKKLNDSILEKIAGIVNSNLIMIRIIDLISIRTLTEDIINRTNNGEEIVRIGNRELKENIFKERSDIQVIHSKIKNLNLKAFCIVKSSKLSKDQIIFIEKILSDLVSYYIIYNSVYYNKNSQ